jgi:hypothetical protein
MPNPIKYIKKQTLGSNNIIIPFGLAIRRGEIPDAFSVQKFGENETAGASEEMIWSDSGAYTWMTKPQAVKVASVGASAGNDDGNPVGTGARTLRIYGLDANYDLQDELITLNGTTAVTSANTYIRIFRAIVESVGSTGSNEGAIDVYDNGGSNEVAHIPIGYNQTMQAEYTIPADYTGYLTRYYASSATNQTIDVFLRVRMKYNAKDGDYVNYVDQVKSKVHIFRGYAQIDLTAPIQIPERSDVYLSAVGSGAVDVAGGFDLYCIK